MSINITNSKVEARMDKAIKHFPTSLRPSKSDFVARAINSYIDVLVKEKVIKSV